MTPTQITGNYRLVKFCPTCQNACPEHLYFRAVEIPTVDKSELYVISHQNIYYRRFASDPGVQCSALAVSSTAGLKVSSTVLRRMDEVTVDRSIDLLAAFYNSPDDIFYLGYEVGPRVCGKHEAPDGLVSLWAVPSSTIRGTHDGREITFQQGVKYLYYFDTKEPCLYEGNAAETGKAQRVDTKASAVTNPNAITPGSALAGPDGKPIGAVTNEGTVITSAGPIEKDAKKPDVLPSPAPPSPAKPVTTSGGSSAGGGSSGKTGKNGSSDARFDARDNPECFPGSAVLLRESGEALAVRDARVGDVVATGRRGDGSLEFEEVFAFSHADARASSQRSLVSLQTAAGNRVRLTQGHLVPVRDYYAGDGSCDSGGGERLVAAGKVEVGMHCMYDIGQVRWVVVDAVTFESASGGASLGKGLYSPHTLVGTVVVDGLLLSCYTTALKPWRAALLLRVVRAFGAGRLVPWVAGMYRALEVAGGSTSRPLQTKMIGDVAQCSGGFETAAGGC